MTARSGPPDPCPYHNDTTPIGVAQGEIPAEPRMAQSVPSPYPRVIPIRQDAAGRDVTIEIDYESE